MENVIMKENKKNEDILTVAFSTFIFFHLNTFSHVKIHKTTINIVVNILCSTEEHTKMHYI